MSRARARANQRNNVNVYGEYHGAAAWPYEINNIYIAEALWPGSDRRHYISAAMPGAACLGVLPRRAGQCGNGAVTWREM